MLKQTTAGYTPDHNAFPELFFRTVGEMIKCRMLQFNSEEELWQDSRIHAVWLLRRVLSSKYVPYQPWLTPRQQKISDRKVTDLIKLQPFETTYWTHINKARRPGKSNIKPRGDQGRLVRYDDDQGSLLARIYFSETGVFELHGNSYILYQNLNEEVANKAGKNLASITTVRDSEKYKYLIGTRHG
jgi:hypothetical protein